MHYEHGVQFSEGLGEHDVPREVQMLAHALARVHGTVVIRRESHGLHLYMPSPIGLEQDGLKELNSRHLTVNADKHLGLGMWRNRVGTYDKEKTGVCHKTDTIFSVSDLKNYPTLESRGIKDVARKVFNNAISREKYLIDDGKGHMIPNHPGLVMPLDALPKDHPAVQYVVGRGYSVDALVRQFRCGYCYAQTPENPSIKLFYKRLPGGFQDTPQGRIIFYVDIKGVQEGWQARIIDKEEGDKKYHWHPYENAWVLTHIKVDDVWHLRPDWKNSPYPWKPSKYRSANGIARSEVVMGFDAAIEWNRNTKQKEYFAALVEGPLDAARFGPPGLAFIGKYLNTGQGSLIARNFKKIIYVTDADEAGRKSKNSIISSLSGKVELHEAKVMQGCKDVGAMLTGDAWGLLKPFIQ